MKSKIVDKLFLLICFTLIFNNIPHQLQMNFIGGPVGWKLVLYPLGLGFLYTLYCQYKYRNVFVHFDEFKKFTIIYLTILMTSLFLELYNYPYYDAVFSGPIDQIEKLPKVLDFFQDHGIVIDQKIALGAWIITRQIKAVFLEVLWCFGGAYMIFCWYYNNWQKAIKIMCEGVLLGLIVIFIYGTVEIFYFLGSHTARNFLEIITPYLHPIKTNHGWWPPLLWPGQLRSVFVEPSHIGNYIALAIPVLWCMYLRDISWKILVMSSYLMFLVFLTQARTSYAMLFGMTILYFSLLLIAYKKKVLLKRFGVICFTGIIIFGIAVQFINYTKNIEMKEKATAADILMNNFSSLASTNQRSNGARYALLKSNFRIALDNPVLGVGKGLATAYIVDYYTENEKQNYEVKNWIKYQEEKGVFSSMASIDGAMNEYVTRLAQNGIIGLGVFLFPFCWVGIKLLKTYKNSDGNKQIDILMILFAIISSLVAGCNLSLNEFYSVWILLGLGFAIAYDEKERIYK